SKSSRGQKINFSDVKKKALELNIPILQPEKLKNDKDAIEKLKQVNPDFIIVVAYGQILTKEILSIPKKACINGHASLLPKYRGASPIQSAILNGDKVTGTTAMLMEEGLDSGAILKQTELTIDKKETAGSLFDKLSYLTADALLYSIKNFDSIKPCIQDESKVSKCAIIKKEYGKIDFANEDAESLERKIRAYNPWPGAYTDDLKIWDADVIDISTDGLKQYKDNIYIKGQELYAKCKDGYLRLNIVQKPGKNKVYAKDFINGIKN
ncbi:MAG: methionyl-tRNA formyltransferase, partial [Methanobacteriaceae archaeon]|nr:methionyl-tRNA formyltransferase [Methanobacteriaceae archaeon]